MRKFSCIVAVLAVAGIAPAQDWIPLDYDAEAAPADNPLKGFIPYTGNYSFPHSMEFDYIGLDTLMRGMDAFTFETGLEPLLNRMAGRGHQAMIRVFIDYPGERNALPEFLTDAGVRQQRYFSDGGGRSPDYQDARLLAALESFIAAFGARYDGDPRIGFIELGLLGHWGEWHTYPQEQLAPTRATQNRVLTAYDAAFDSTRLLVSQDLLGYAQPADIALHDIGLHDDDFANNTLPPGADQFWSRVLAQGLGDLWQTRVIGGEVQPDYQDVIWNQPSGAPEDFFAAASTTHASWMLNHAAFENNWPAAKRERALAAARALGYKLFVPEARINATLVNEVMVDVRMENAGVAPFYYDWPVLLALLGEEGEPLVQVETDWALSAVLPGATVEFSATLNAGNLPGGAYQVALRVQNPLENGRRLRFANAQQGECWLALGTLVLADNPAADASLLENIDGCPEEASGGEGEGEGEEEKTPAICGPGAGNAAGGTGDYAMLLAVLAALLFRSRRRKLGA